MNYVEFRKLVADHLKGDSINIYPSFVPEDASLPAISYTNLADISSSRDISGSRNGKITTWRLIIVARSYYEMEDIRGKIEILDNTAVGLGRVFVEYSTVTGKSPDSDLINAVIDLKIFQGR